QTTKTKTPQPAPASATLAIAGVSMAAKANCSAEPAGFNLSKYNSIASRLPIWLSGLLVGSSIILLAQQRTTTPTTRAGAGAGAGAGGSTASGSTRQYYSNGEVGDAMISVDPE